MNDRGRRYSAPATSSDPHAEDSGAPGGTPLQRACWHLGEAVKAAREDERANRAFIDVLIERTAVESLRLLGESA